MDIDHVFHGSLEDPFSWRKNPNHEMILSVASEKKKKNRGHLLAHISESLNSFQAWLDPEAQMSFSLYLCPLLLLYLFHSQMDF